MAEEQTVVEVSSDDTLSFILDEDNNVLELVRFDADGNLFYREAEKWVAVVDEDSPTIYDQELKDIIPDQTNSAIRFYDSVADIGDEIDSDEISEFIASVQ